MSLQATTMPGWRRLPRRAGLQLRPRNVRVFDEVVDIVNFDLVIVADHFDLTEVSALRPAPTLYSHQHASAAGVSQEYGWTLLPKSCLAWIQAACNYRVDICHWHALQSLTCVSMWPGGA